VIGSVFEARYEPAEGGAIHPFIRGRAHVTLDARVVFDPALAKVRLPVLLSPRLGVACVDLRVRCDPCVLALATVRVDARLVRLRGKLGARARVRLRFLNCLRFFRVTCSRLAMVGLRFCVSQ